MPCESERKRRKNQGTRQPTPIIPVKTIIGLASLSVATKFLSELGK